jgi:uncharacterized repeat protein (TIGR01451 family)
MKNEPKQNASKAGSSNRAFTLSCAVVSMLLAGCAQEQKGFYRRPAAATPAPASKAAIPPPPKAGEYGPGYVTVEVGGNRYIKGSMAFPTGLRNSSGLLVEKIVPEEVLAGQPFEYQYRVINLTGYPLHLVVLTERVGDNFKLAEADPKPNETRAGLATWQLGTLGANETKIIRIRGSGQAEGAIDTCCWASYSPLLCEPIKIVKASMELTTRAPVESSSCDPVAITLTVKNTGTSRLTGLKLVDTLPDGLTSDGKSSLAIDAGMLMPGENREFTFKAVAARPGKFVNTAKISSAQGLAADTSSTTVVHQPILTAACKAREEQYIGRAFDVCFTVTSKGDTAAAGAVLELPIPPGVTLRSATAGGRALGNRVVWELGSLAPDASAQVCGTFTSAGAGTIGFIGTAKAACAKAVVATCETRVIGVQAILLEKADDPDPIQVGETTTYTVKITNQGTADDNNVALVATFPPEITPVGAGEGKVNGQTVTFPNLSSLKPKQTVVYKLVGKGVKVGDAHVRFTLLSDTLKSPISAEESTHVY